MSDKLPDFIHEPVIADREAERAHVIREAGFAIRRAQLLRIQGILSREAAVHVIFWNCETLATMDRIMRDERMKSIDDRVRELNIAYGLEEDEEFSYEDMPDEIRVLDAEYSALMDEHYAAVLESFGENELARLYRSDKDRFMSVVEEGRKIVMGVRYH